MKIIFKIFLVFLILFFSIVPVMSSGIHAVIGVVRYEDGSSPASVSWSAYLTDNAGEILTFNSNDTETTTSIYDVENGSFLFQCSGFSSWQAGQVLHMDISDNLDATGMVEVELTYNAWDSAGVVLLTVGPEPHPVTGSIKYNDNTIPAALQWNAWITARPNEVIAFDSANPGETASSYDSNSGAFSIECAEFTSWAASETLHVEFDDKAGVTTSVDVPLTSSAGDDAGTVVLQKGPPAHTVTGNVIYKDSSSPATVSWSAWITARPQDVVSFNYETPPASDAAYNPETGAFVIDCTEFSTWSPAETLHVELTDNLGAFVTFNVVLTGNNGDAAGILMLMTGPGPHSVIGTLVYDDESIPETITWSMYITARPQDVVTFNSATDVDTDSEYNADTGGFLIECSELTSWSPAETLHVEFNDLDEGHASFELVLSNNATDDAGTVIVQRSSGVEQEKQSTPTGFALLQNYPNPFNPVTTVSFQLEKAQDVSLVVYNAMGQVVRTLANGFYQQGKHQLTWDGKNNQHQRLSSGIYYFKLVGEHSSATLKTLLVK